MTGPAPRRLGPHVVEAEIGRGGMGVVYRAWQPELERRVAVKVIREDLLASDLERERFRVEARAAARLSHGNIVRIFDLGTEGDQIFLSMELVDGPDLARLVAAEGPWDPARAAGTVAKLARAMAHAHAAGLVHRDLKPANVLVASDGEPRIADFGIALEVQRASRLREGDVSAGTPGWLAPEQVEGRLRDQGPRTDVHGLGGILYFLLTGQPPYSGESEEATLIQVLTSPPRPPRALRPSIPRDVSAIALKCLEKRPEQRYEDALGLAEDLDLFLAGEPVAARPRDVLSVARRWLGLHPLLVLTWGALGAFYVAEKIILRRFPDPDQRAFHDWAVLVIASWAALAGLFEIALERAKRRPLVHAAWSVMEAGLLGALLLLGDGPSSAIVPILALPIVGSALRLDRLVVFVATAACIAAYVVSWILAAWLGLGEPASAQEAIVQVLTLACLGALSAVLAMRLRAGIGRRAA